MLNRESGKCLLSFYQKETRYGIKFVCFDRTATETKLFYFHFIQGMCVVNLPNIIKKNQLGTTKS